MYMYKKEQIYFGQIEFGRRGGSEWEKWNIDRTS